MTTAAADTVADTVAMTTVAAVSPCTHVKYCSGHFLRMCFFFLAIMTTCLISGEDTTPSFKMIDDIDGVAKVRLICMNLTS